MDIDMTALRLLEREREIPMDIIVEAIEAALLSAYQKIEGHYHHARVELDRKAGTVTVCGRTPAEVAAETSTEAVPDAGPVPPVVATPPADTAWPAEPHTTRQTPSAAGVTR